MEIQFCRAERVPLIKPKFMSPAGLLSGAPTQGQTVLGPTHKSQPQNFWMDLCAGQRSPPSGRLWWEDPELQNPYKRSSNKTTGLFIIQLSKSCRESHSRGGGGEAEGGASTFICWINVSGGCIYFCIKGLKTRDCMSWSARLLHSICPGGIACLGAGLGGIANALYGYPMCACGRVTIFITGQLHKN